MALLLNGTTGYLEMAAKVVSGFPCSMLVWVSSSGGGGAQFWFQQSQSNADRYIGVWLDANGSSKYGQVRNPGNGDSATKTSTPNPDTTLQLAVVVLTSTTSRTVYYGSSTGVTSTTSLTDDITNHDRVTVGAYHYNGNSASLFTNGSIAESHFYNAALSSTDISNILAGTLPETVSGWVDGWDLKTLGAYTSLGGSRTLTAVGGVSQSALVHPVTRSTYLPFNPVPRLGPLLAQ